MMKLNDSLVTEIEFKGKEYPLDLAFDTILTVFDYLNNRHLLPYERLELALIALIGKNDLSQEEQYQLYSEILNQHILLAKQDHFIEKDIMGNPMPIQDEKIMDIEKDAKFIFASFFQIGINLFEQQGKLSWLEFQSLLESLPDDSIMSKIIQIRKWKPRKGDSHEHIAEMRRLQKKYSLEEKAGE